MRKMTRRCDSSVRLGGGAFFLHRNRAGNRIHNGTELGDDAVDHQLDDAAVITALKRDSCAISWLRRSCRFSCVGVGRIALIHPPWFADDENQLGIAYFRNQGFDVVYVSQMNLRGLPVAKPTDPLRKFTEVYPAELYAFSRTQVPAAAEAFSWWKRLPRDWRHCGAGALGVPVLMATRWHSGMRCGKPVCVSQ
jgi:hypothetical protein